VEDIPFSLNAFGLIAAHQEGTKRVRHAYGDLKVGVRILFSGCVKFSGRVRASYEDAGEASIRCVDVCVLLTQGAKNGAPAREDRKEGKEMTPQEQDMLGGLIDRVQKTQLAEKDTDAEQMLGEGLGKNSDALYILAQTVLVQKYALEQAQAQLAEAKAQMEQMQQRPEPKHATSFLGNLLGRNDAPAAQTPPPPPPAPSGQGWSQVPPAYTQGAPVAYPQYGAPMGVGGGFLQGALQTAAGVAAGALAFEGVESLMHGFGHAAGYGQGFGGLGGEERPTEVINNYYGEERGGEHGVSSSEHAMGDQMDRDLGGGKDHGDLLFGSGRDGGSSNSSSDPSNGGDDSGYDNGGTNFDDTSYEGGGDFGDGGSGGGDDGSF
jgi:uncharacterized protein